MTRKSLTITLTLIAIAVGGILSLTIIYGAASKPEAVETQSDLNEEPTRPMIIWYQRLEGDLKAMDVAISSGVFSHVMLRWLHEYDRPMNLDNPNIKKALSICKDKDIKIIWTRWLWPGYNHIKVPFKLKDIYAVSYYVQRITNIRKEAELMGVDLVALDAEPYANSELVPLKPRKPRKLSETQFNTIHNAIQDAVKVTGQVDFVLPAGTFSRKHLYDATKSLGKLVITEYTYFDVPFRLQDKTQPYDIFGAYVAINKKNRGIPDLPFFTPREILERQYLWAHKKGLFVYPGGSEDCLAVATEFSKIQTINSSHDSNKSP